MSTQPMFDFDGATYCRKHDQVRLNRQLDRVREFMGCGNWHSLSTIACYAECSEPSASARLRDLRKPRFGGYTVERKRVEGGLFLYRVVTR
jgi:hypothetical protein